ncbi:NUDIX domain-containing protein [Candidatus Uhrbacteria bacterium]|nr:NUDIX domain-containing protein [Candidatus Uhrbacteria bacterium]
MKLSYPIVNNSDQIIGYKKKDQAYKEKSMLRSVQIFVYNSKGQLFIQKRSKNKSRYPNYFCASVAGHVELGENYREAAIRELKEELGLKKIKKIKFISKEKTPVGKGIYAMMAFFTMKTNELITLQKEEVDSGNFYTIKNIQQLILRKKRFTPSFLFIFKKQQKNEQLD